MSDGPSVAKSGWILFGVGLLAVSPFIPPNQIGLLLPAIFAPALVYGGGWLLAGALFTLVMSVISERRASD